MQPDILIFLSDQHHGHMMGYKGTYDVNTPHLDQLAKDGVAFDEAYTSCPLCVPSRMSFLTSRLPSKLGVFTNDSCIASDDLTFLHSLAIVGYETVLCGRMHFMGPDQRHGFTKRIMDEITPLYWGRGGKERKDLGKFVETFGPGRCLEVIGGGESPVLDYDRQVIAAAIDYLSQDHDKPQCIVVGTYAPHFTYVAPEEDYVYYMEKDQDAIEEDFHESHPIYAKRQVSLKREKLEALRASYKGMVTNLDRQLGQVRQAWKAYLERQGRKGCFLYMSDHGDQIGEHKLIGKQTFYEGSVKIPLIIEGDGIEGGREMSTPVSIMDIGPTLCHISDAPQLPVSDGVSLMQLLRREQMDMDRYVLSEFMDKDKDGALTFGRMLRRGPWKYITYSNNEEYDYLFNIRHDPGEYINYIKDEPEVIDNFKRDMINAWDLERIFQTYAEKSLSFSYLAQWGKQVKPDEPERWEVPEYKG